MKAFVFISFLLCFWSFVVSDDADSLEKGWGKEIKWRKLEGGKKEAKASNKPIMVLLTKNWCGACKALRPKFADSNEIAQLSKKFVMIHLEDDEEPDSEEFRVDGRYIPRIYFLAPDGSVLKEVYNTKGRHTDTKFYYGKISEILRSMKTMLKKYGLADGIDMEEEKEDKQEKEQGQKSTSKLARGFGDRINWVTYEEGLKEAKASKKMLILLIHKTYCGSCKTLKPKFAASDKLAEMSKKFVMVNVEDEEEPTGSQFVVDGEYVPRIFFMGPDGKVDESIWNEDTKHKHVKYYYGSAEELIMSMKRALGKSETDEEKSESEKGEKKDPWWTPMKGKSLARGLGDHIDWVTYEDGLKIAKQSGKPMLLISTKTSCSSCKILKPKLASHKEFGDMSKKFVMVHVVGEEEPAGEMFMLDGQYVPRILFIAPNGKVLKEFWNEGTEHPHVKYYYQNGDELVKSMKRVLKKFQPTAKSYGWGDGFKWVNFEEAFDLGKEQKKPVMLIIHKSWCGACKAFKPRFAKSKDILKQSENFVMVNIEDDKQTMNKEFDVDGAYVPRIYFVDPFTKKIMKEFHNDDKDYEDYKYAYGDVKDLVKVMKAAAKKEVEEEGASGFGKTITWLNLDDGLKQAKETNKRVMLVMHRSWCQHSQDLKTKFADSKEIEELSNNLIMVNLQDDEIPDDKYNVDGSYVPRIVFLDPAGDVIKTVNNTDSPVEDAAFFYNDVKQIVKGMRKAIPAFNLDNGFGTDIKWMTLSDGIADAKASDKHVMVIIHKPWCGACKALKSEFVGSNEIEELSQKFAMVNLEGDLDEAKDNKFDVDGKYYPRIFFMDPAGMVKKEFHNTELDYLKYKYSYATAEQVVSSMRRCLGESPSKKKTKDSPKETKESPKETKESPKEIKESPKETNDSTKETEDSTKESKNPLAKGLGDDYSWMRLKDGLVEAKKSWRPMMVVLHLKGCDVCKILKPRFAKSEKIKDLSRHFIMVNTEDEVDLKDERFNIDGMYIPRIIFLDPLGIAITDVWNTETIYKENKYYYWESQSIVASMRKAYEKFQVMDKPSKRVEL